MKDNLFVKKSQERKEHARKMMIEHVRELKALYDHFDEQDPTKERIGKRLQEARDAAKDL